MLLKTLRLHNIRSYLDQKIEFPKGSSLLAGDIGSGKSTILLSIEFALFGIKASELSGAALLRNGKREGSVELEFEVEGKQILIKRNLKQGANGVVQDAGFVIIDGIKKEGTPKELRAMVFEILGYPKELLSRSKDLIYRYTVYTPQEALKEILFAKREERLDILRRVFNIDKYKRIRENSIILLATMREKRKELEGISSNLSEKKEERSKHQASSAKIEQRMNAALPLLEKSKEKVKEKKALLEKNESMIQKHQASLRDLALLDSKLALILESRKRNTSESLTLESDLAYLRKEIEGKETADLEKELSSKRNEQIALEKKLRETLQNIQTLLAKIGQSEEMEKKVEKLDHCPICKQNVGKEHKHEISGEESRKREVWKDLLEQEKAKEAKIQKEHLDLGNALEILQKRKSESDLIAYKKNQIGRKEEAKSRLLAQMENQKKEVGEISLKKRELQSLIDQNKDIEKGYHLLKEEFERAQREERVLEIQIASEKKEKEGFDRIIASLEKDILQKEEAEKSLRKIKEASEWVHSFFMNLMLTIERHVMRQINLEFNELFRSWCQTLLEDEAISVRLDDEFTPIIEQNGYETSIENLSGGEKTSIALAYRLALNKVINDVVSQIKTRDILMLDEPTDGFSTEQLDKVREVLDLLGIPQIILVSHEAKIESFVDSVIRISKQDHVSKVA